MRPVLRVVICSSSAVVLGMAAPSEVAAVDTVELARRARDTARTLTVLDGAREYRARPLDSCRVVVETVWDRFAPVAGQRVDTVTHDLCVGTHGEGLAMPVLPHSIEPAVARCVADARLQGSAVLNAGGYEVICTRQYKGAVQVTVSDPAGLVVRQELRPSSD